jgi:hypothetical protein
MFLTRSERYEYRLYRRNRRRRRLVLFLAVVLILAVAGLSRHGLSHHGRLQPGHPRHATTRRTTSPAAGTRIRTTGSARAADLPLAAAGTGLTWSGFHGIALPGSAHDGPHHTRGGLAWGFSDTPRGALLAAVNIAVRTAAQWGPAIYQPTIRRQVTGPAARTLLAADASGYAALRAAARVRPGQPAGRAYAVEAAYRFTAYGPRTAAVDIVTEGPASIGTTVLAVTRIRLAWQRGDWRVIAPPGGDWASSATATSSLSGYTTFPSER